MIRSSFILLDRAMGRCPRCMRKAFLAALAAWALAFAMIGLSVASWITTSMIVVALGLTALWLAHIAAFALRTVMATKHATGDLFTSKTAQMAAHPPFNRRQFAVEFVRTAALAVVATALTVRANSVLAAGNCDCSKCRSDQVCCHTANGYCGCFPKGIQC